MFEDVIPYQKSPGGYNRNFVKLIMVQIIPYQKSPGGYNVKSGYCFHLACPSLILSLYHFMALIANFWGEYNYVITMPFCYGILSTIRSAVWLYLISKTFTAHVWGFLSQDKEVTTRRARGTQGETDAGLWQKNHTWAVNVFEMRYNQTADLIVESIP